MSHVAGFWLYALVGLFALGASIRIGVEIHGPHAVFAEPKVNQELAKFQGEWNAVSGEYKGRIELAKKGASVYRFKGNTLVDRFGGKVSSEATIAVYASQGTKMIDVELNAEGGQSGGFVGIYEFMADGTLRLALAPKSGERPKVFPTTPVTTHRLIVLRKVQKRETERE